jgi:hypothetical protein
MPIELYRCCITFMVFNDVARFFFFTKKSRFIQQKGDKSEERVETRFEHDSMAY